MLRAPVDAVVIGGGPAGSTAARLLAAWGHPVIVLDQPTPRERGLAESIPPSARKLLAEVGTLAAVDASGFLRSTGNTAWWASEDARVEAFGASALGYQVFRPELDAVLIDSARSAGAEVRTPARVSSVAFGGDAARVDCDIAGVREPLQARIVLDASGRAGVVGRRYRVAQPGHRTHAMIGVWQRSSWNIPDDTHTLVETFDEGWAWSVPVSATRRHVGLMVDAACPYRATLAKARQVSRTLDGATLTHEWACDASLYSSTTYGGSQFLLVGDAGSFIDPLSSFGVKKALASAWMAAVVTHTVLEHPDRRDAALAYFTQWEREIYLTHLRRSRDFAREAYKAHPGAFWMMRAEVEVEEVQDWDRMGHAALCRPGDACEHRLSPLSCSGAA